MYHRMLVKLSELGELGGDGVQRCPLLALPDISGLGVERVYVQVFLVVWGGAPGVLWRLDRCQSWMVGKVLKRCFEKRCKIDGASTATLLELAKRGMPGGLTS